MRTLFLASLCLVTTLVSAGCRSFPLPPPSLLADAGARIGAAAIGTTVAARREAARRAYYRRAIRAESHSWADHVDVEPVDEFESAEFADEPRFVEQPARRPARRPHAPRRTLPVGIGLEYFAANINGNLCYHRDYTEDSDDTSLGDTFGLSGGDFIGLSLEIRPEKTIGFQASLMGGRFASSTHFEGEPFTYDGTLLTSPDGQNELLMIMGKALLDFRTGSWSRGNFDLLLGFTYIGAQLDSVSLSENTHSLQLTGGAELSFHLIPHRLHFDLGVELGLGLDGGLAGIEASILFQPVSRFHIRAGARAKAAFIDDVDFDSWAGDSMDFTLYGVFTEITLRF